MGLIAEQYWLEIPNHNPFVLLDTFVIMPNHIHGIIFINKNNDLETHKYASNVEPNNYEPNVEPDNNEPNVKPHNCEALPPHLPPHLPPYPSPINKWQPNNFGPQSQNIPAIIRGFKSSVKRYANLNNIEFEWQMKYYDRIIRTQEEMQRIQIYISNNIINWHKDKHFTNI
jgi:putative transposase